MAVKKFMEFFGNVNNQAWMPDMNRSNKYEDQRRFERSLDENSLQELENN